MLPIGTGQGRRAPVPFVRRRAVTRLVSLGGALAAVLTLIVWLKPGRDLVRAKGGLQLGFYVKHDEKVRRGAEHEVVAPGDALRFTYTAQEPRFLAILSVDPTARVSVYYPAPALGEPAAAPEAPGRDVALPLSTVLDGTTGKETIYGVFCEGPVDVGRLELALLQHPAKLDAPKGCSVVTVPIEKRKRE